MHQLHPNFQNIKEMKPVSDMKTILRNLMSLQLEYTCHMCPVSASHELVNLFFTVHVGPKTSEVVSTHPDSDNLSLFHLQSFS